jgi:hypothetical protein
MDGQMLFQCSCGLNFIMHGHPKSAFCHLRATCDVNLEIGANVKKNTCVLITGRQLLIEAGNSFHET